MVIGQAAVSVQWIVKNWREELFGESSPRNGRWWRNGEISADWCRTMQNTIWSRWCETNVLLRQTFCREILWLHTNLRRLLKDSLERILFSDRQHHRQGHQMLSASVHGRPNSRNLSFSRFLSPSPHLSLTRPNAGSISAEAFLPQQPSPELMKVYQRLWLPSIPSIHELFANEE